MQHLEVGLKQISLALTTISSAHGICYIDVLHKIFLSDKRKISLSDKKIENTTTDAQLRKILNCSLALDVYTLPRRNDRKMQSVSTAQFEWHVSSKQATEKGLNK